MPCLSCQRLGPIAIARIRAGGPTSDVPVLIARSMGTHGRRFNPDAFLSPRLCMVCGVVFCPLAPEVPKEFQAVRPDEPDDRVFAATEPVTGSAVTLRQHDPSRPVSPGGAVVLRRSDPGLDDEFALRTANRILPIPISVEFRPNTAIAVLNLLEERCMGTRGATSDAQMEEARKVLSRAVMAWRELVGEPEE